MILFQFPVILLEKLMDYEILITNARNNTKNKVKK